MTETDLRASGLKLRAAGINPEAVKEAFLGGSRVICDPAPTDTDCDIVLLVSSIEHFKAGQTFDWKSPIDSARYAGEGDTFQTFRRGEYNLMVFDDPTEYGAVLGATALAKHLNMQDKQDRYKLFEVVRSPWR